MAIADNPNDDALSDVELSQNGAEKPDEHGSHSYSPSSIENGKDSDPETSPSKSSNDDTSSRVGGLITETIGSPDSREVDNTNSDDPPLGANSSPSSDPETSSKSSKNAQGTKVDNDLGDVGSPNSSITAKNSDDPRQEANSNPSSPQTGSEGSPSPQSPPNTDTIHSPANSDDESPGSPPQDDRGSPMPAVGSPDRQVYNKDTGPAKSMKQSPVEHVNGSSPDDEDPNSTIKENTASKSDKDLDSTMK